MIRLFKTPDIKRKLFVFAGDALIMMSVVPFLILFHTFVVEHGILKNVVRPLKPYALYVCPFINVLIFYIFELYDVKGREKLRTFIFLLAASFLSFCLMFGLAKVLRINRLTMIYIFIFFGTCIFPLFYWRLICRKILVASRQLLKQRVLFIETDSITEDILQEMKRSDYKVVGLLTQNDSNLGGRKNEPAIIGSWKDLQQIVQTKKVNILVSATNANLSLSVMKNIYKCRLSGIEVYDSTYFYEILARKVTIKPYLENNHVPYLNIHTFATPLYKNTKRLIDFCGALFLLITLSPLLVVTMILVKLTSKGPVSFVQKRLGLQEEPFNIIKFRTMVHDAEKENGPSWANKNDNRVTVVGRFLRKTRLDEVPQLINILKGDISFVGPRPIRRHFADIIEEQMPFYSLRFTIKPGLTGWAQVNYHYGGTIKGHIEKCQYDLYYIKHASIFLDIFIILKTFQTIVQRPAY